MYRPKGKDIVTTEPAELSDLEQQQDPRGDLLKARPGGETEPGGLVPPYDKGSDDKS
jgi:hypothetical protein